MAIALNNVNKEKISYPNKGRLSSTRLKQISPDRFIHLFTKRVNGKELIFFVSQLSLMMDVGMPLTDAMGALSKQTKKAYFRQVIQDIQKSLEEGKDLSEALKKHPNVFDPLFINMVKAGEKGGFLKENLDRSARMMEKRRELMNKVRGATTYPMVLCGVGILVLVFVLVVILPKFLNLFKGKEDFLPWTTQTLMAMSYSIRDYWPAYVITFLTVVIGFKLWKDTKNGQRVLSYCFANGPVIKRLSNNINTCELLRSLGHLMESHVPLIDALKLTYESTKNLYFKRFVKDIRDNVEQGGKFSTPFQSNPHILDSVKNMVSTGEEVGELAKVMLRLTEYYDQDVDNELKSITSMIEPAALIVLGVLVGVVVSSVILPLFRITHLLH